MLAELSRARLHGTSTSVNAGKYSSKRSRARLSGDYTSVGLRLVNTSLWTRWMEILSDGNAMASLVGHGQNYKIRAVRKRSMQRLMPVEVSSPFPCEYFRKFGCAEAGEALAFEFVGHV